VCFVQINQPLLFTSVTVDAEDATEVDTVVVGADDVEERLLLLLTEFVSAELDPAVESLATPPLTNEVPSPYK